MTMIDQLTEHEALEAHTQTILHGSDANRNCTSFITGTRTAISR